MVFIIGVAKKLNHPKIPESSFNLSKLFGNTPPPSNSRKNLFFEYYVVVYQVAVKCCHGAYDNLVLDQVQTLVLTPHLAKWLRTVVMCTEPSKSRRSKRRERRNEK